MSFLPAPYGQSLALLTDLYELTMASGYWKTGMADREAVFHLYFRKQPFEGGFAVACGIEPAAQFLEAFRFDASDLKYLSSLKDALGEPLFETRFLDYLGELRLSCDIDAVAEGTLVFPPEPLLRVRGPLLQCQLLETALLNIVNFQTLIATKAARITLAAQGDPVLEFGLRRAQGIDGGLAASRAAYIGGCAATSNVLAGKLYGIPVRGTHAHSWVMAFESEAAAFDAWADAMPGNAIFLVDTYDTIEGVRAAIHAGERLRSRGYEMTGVRLDSGDLAALSRTARRMLDAAGFEKSVIVGSGDLDEQSIVRLKEQGCSVAVWGVGTRLVTGYDDPALGGVYKLAAIREPDGTWTDRRKVADGSDKSSLPGLQQVRRFRSGGKATADVIYDERRGLTQTARAMSWSDPDRELELPQGATEEDLLRPLIRDGRRAGDPQEINATRARVRAELASMPAAALALRSPTEYAVGVEETLLRPIARS